MLRVLVVVENTKRANLRASWTNTSGERGLCTFELNDLDDTRPRAWLCFVKFMLYKDDWLGSDVESFRLGYDCVDQAVIAKRRMERGGK